MKKLILLFADIAVLYGALALTLLLRYGGDRFAQAWNIHVVPFSIIFVLWLVVFYTGNLYDTSVLRNTIIFFGTFGRTLAAAGILSALFFYLIPYFGITPRANLFTFVVVFAILEFLNRTLFNHVIERRFKKRVLIVGVTPQGLELAQFLRDNPQLGYDLRGIVDVQTNHETIREEDRRAYNIVSDGGDIENLIKHEMVSVVVMSPEAYQIKEIIDAFYRLLEHRVSFYHLASFYERTTGRIPLGAINQIWFLENISEGTRKFY